MCVYLSPMWEDAANKQGGRWVITLNKSSKNDLDNLWLDVVSNEKADVYFRVNLTINFLFRLAALFDWRGIRSLGSDLRRCCQYSRQEQQDM